MSGFDAFTFALRGNGCAPHSMVDSLAQCKQAAFQLGLPFEKSVFSDPEGPPSLFRPPGCFYDQVKGGTIYFNSNLDTPFVNGWVGVKGVCTTDNYEFAEPGNDCRTSQIITSLAECKKAADALDLPFRKVVNSRIPGAPIESGLDRPRGCFHDRVKGGRIYFNANFLTPFVNGWVGVKGVCTEEPYSVAPAGNGCSKPNVIDSLVQCRDAADELGVPFEKSVSDDRRPPGCFHDRVKGGRIYFNTKLSNIFVDGWVGVKGVCRNPL